jgi:integrase
MAKHNPDNERIKRRYFAYLKEAKQHSEATMGAAAKALSRFEEYTKYRNFKTYHFQQAVAFKRHLAEQTGLRSGEKLSKGTLHSTLMQLKQFFFWLAGQPGYKGRFQYSDSDYFNLSENDTRIATAHREQKAPTLEQVRRVIEAMPRKTEIERRNRALVAFTLLTGARDSAIASMRLKHLDLKEGCVYQDPKEVKTKFRKTFMTYFLPVGDGIRKIVADWVRFLLEEKLWGNEDPLFPATCIMVGQTKQFEVAGLERANWTSAQPIRKIFRDAFEGAGLPYFHPHSLRKTLARLGEEVCSTPEEFKAWSQNLGHDKVLTTFMSYGSVATDRQGEIINNLSKKKQPKLTEADEFAEAVLRKLRSEGGDFPPIR